MTTYGVTPAGFVAKRLADIKKEMEDDARGTFGVEINLDPSEPLGQYIGIMAEREAKLWELAEDVYDSQYPDTSEGVQLEKIVALTGDTKNPATKSRVLATLIGTAGTVIEQGKVASVAGNASARFATESAATIAAGVDEVQTVAVARAPTTGSFSLEHDGSPTALIDKDATSATVQAALRAITGLENLTVTGSYAGGSFSVTFAGTAGKQNQPQLVVINNTLADGAGAIAVTVTTATAGRKPQVDVYMSAETTGAVQAPAASLTVIETPVAGWSEITNALDAVVGQEIETDPDLKIRRRSMIKTAAAGPTEAIRSRLLKLDEVTSANVFANRTITTDADGRPAKSIEALVRGGDEDEIAETLWKAHAGGIETFGTITKTVTDSEGNPQTVKFSRPTEIPIYVELDITKDARWPTNGITLVKDQVMAYGATLGNGDDVIVLPTLISYLGTIPGITNVVVRIGTAPSPVGSSNVAIAVKEIADFDTSRIAVAVA